ncbi:unnamed protein product [Dibothriocephalus latus]|uniref:Uncharacterized protein n=1 Tax=Dibothriocephalus latus TaxID=60516 RepID=A0A3P6SE34_DIBLA|nr:unnamed protein product [Dibothriocephalus latus]
MCIAMADTLDKFQLKEGKLNLLEGYLYTLAITTEIIFISSGFNTTISKLTGRICQRAAEYLQAEKADYPTKYRSIGILPWSRVKHSEVLEATGEINYPACDDDDSTKQYHLCPAYRDFIMIDDGYRRGRSGPNFDSYAAGICEKIRAPKTEKGWGLPVILVVAGGDYEVLRTVFAYTGIGLPVVVIRNNAGAPNALWEVHKLYTNSRKDVTQLKNGIKRILVENLSLQDSQPLIKEMIKICSRIAERWDLIKFVSLNEESDLDIIQSITVETAENDIGAVKLAVKLDRTDLAKERLSSVQKLPDVCDMEELLTDLLIEENLEFIDLLLNFNLSMERYLTIEALQKLIVDSMHGEFQSTSVFWVLDFQHFLTSGIALEGSCDTTVAKCYMVIAMITKNLDILLPGVKYLGDTQLCLVVFFTCIKNQELFLWAILRQRHELALFLWRKCKDSVFLAVFASSLSRQIAQVIPSHERQRTVQVLANADEFEDLAVTMMSSCANVYPNIKWTIPTLTKISWNCADTEWLGLVGKCRRFMGTREMQDYINFKWTNNMSSGTLPVAAALVCPPLFALSYFSTERTEAMTQEEIKERSIDDSEIRNCVGGDRYIVTKQLSVGKIIALTYMSARAKFLLRFMMYVLFLFFATNTVLSEMPEDRYTVSELLLAIMLFIQVLDSGFPFVVMARKCGRHHLQFFLSLSFIWCETAIALQLIICLLLRLFLKENFFLMKSFAAVLCEQEGCPTNDTTVRCPVFNAFVPVILACYMLMANIFLVNFLIAIFNNVIEEVEAEALGVWKYNLLLEAEIYECRYILPPPLTIFEMIYHAFEALFCRKRKSTELDSEAKAKAESEEAEEDAGITVSVGGEESNKHVVPRELKLQESQEAFIQANQAVLNLALIETERAEQEAESQMEMARVITLRQTVEGVLNEAEGSLDALTMTEEKVKRKHSTLELHTDRDEDEEAKVEEEAPPSVEEVQQLLLDFEGRLLSDQDFRLFSPSSENCNFPSGRRLLLLLVVVLLLILHITYGARIPPKFMTSG